MLFSEPIYIFLFLPLALFLYIVTGQRNVVLLAISLVFYTWGEPLLVFVMLGTVLINYGFGVGLGAFQDKRSASARFVLSAGICANLGILGFFKYLDFTISIVNPAIFALGFTPFKYQHIPLPLGISFFTFQAISYLIDICRMECKPQRNIIDFALFKTLFPQLIAGPIVRYTELSKQLTKRSLKLSLFAQGIRQFIVGLAKKVLVADIIAVSVDRIFGLPGEQLSASLAWTGAALFMIQIYFDFSGYTDMAIGVGKMLGFELPNNFNYPYSALSIQDFWHRWHMTLSRWFRDYLYIPLGGNRKSAARTSINLLIVFLMCGLWHGASLTYVAWGLYHGVFLMIERTRVGAFIGESPVILRRVYVLLVLLVGWIIFRAESLTQVVDFARAMLGLNGFSNHLQQLRAYTDSMTFISATVGVAFSFPILQRLDFSTLQRRGQSGTSQLYFLITTGVEVAAYSFLFLLCLAFSAGQTHRAFIYFRF